MIIEIETEQEDDESMLPPLVITHRNRREYEAMDVEEESDVHMSQVCDIPRSSVVVTKKVKNIKWRDTQGSSH